MRGTVIQLAAVAVLVALASSVLYTQQDPLFVVVVNKANPVKSLALPELRRIFMKQSRMWPHGEPIVPVDWDASNPLREIFSRRVLARSVREMADYWVQQSVTQGLTPPSTQRSTRAMLRFVGSVAGAIGYVPPAEVDDTVSIVKVPGLP